MSKKKTLWKREFPCLVCETPMVNYQFMTKSQSIVYDDWMVSHMQAIGEYEDYPEVLKTSVCPSCLTASNEYNYGVDTQIYFTRNPRKNQQIKNGFLQCIEDRFNVLANEYERFEEECSLLDRQKNKPANTRSKATFQKIWSQRNAYGIPFFRLMFEEPRDYVTALVCYALDRYCQMVRICYNLDIDPANRDYDSLAEAIVQKLSAEPLSIKAPDPRLYFITTNYLQSIQFLEEMEKDLYPERVGKYEILKQQYWTEAYQFMKQSMANEDIRAIPCELKEGGINLLMARLHHKFGDTEAGNQCLRIAKNYADNRLKHIASNNQQKFVNDVDAMVKLYIN